MKLRWKIICLFAVLALDIALGRSMYGFYQEAKSTLFLPADAGDSAQSEVRRQFSGENRLRLPSTIGPHSVYTSQLLDGLRERGVHATFFSWGKYRRKRRGDPPDEGGWPSDWKSRIYPCADE